MGYSVIFVIALVLFGWYLEAKQSGAKEATKLYAFGGGIFITGFAMARFLGDTKGPLLLLIIIIIATVFTVIHRMRNLPKPSR